VTEIQFVLISLIVLFVLDLITVAARASLLHANLARLLAQREQMEPQVHRTIILIHSLPRLQASLNFAQAALRFLMVGLILTYAFRQSENLPFYVVAGILLLAALLVFWIEWIVEGRVLRNSETWALRLTTYVRFLLIFLSPLTLVPLYLSGDMQDTTDGSPTLTVTEDELKSLVDAGQEEGLLEQGERKMIYSIFAMGDTLAREIMIPRIDILALDVITPLPEAVDALLKSGHSRVPVYEESVDKILGLLYAKDLLRLWREGQQIDSLRDLLRPAYFIPEAKKVDELLAEMQNQRIHMAIVVDEYGGVAGVVTLEDIVEEILGEIQDEYDQGEESPYQELPDGEFVFQGRVDLDDFNEVIGCNLPKDEADTIGGFIYSRIGRVPSSGENIQVDNLLLTVEQVSARRIRKVRARWISSSLQSEEEVTHVDG